MEIDSVNSQNLYFQQANALALSHSKNQKTDKTEKKSSVRKSSFASAMERSQEEATLVQAGLPAAIAGMDVEEAAIFLKDEADMAADRLRESQMPAEFEEYRRKVSQFLRFLEKNNFEVTVKQQRGKRRDGRPRDPRVQIKIINSELDIMARQMLLSHKDTITMLAKIDEINGMLVDLIAA